MNTLTAVGRNAVVLFLSQAPVVAGLYGFWPQAKDQPYAALASVLVWESLIGVGVFLRDVWKEELEKDARKVCADGIRTIASSLANWLKNYRPGFQKKYLRHLIREYGLFNDRGLGLINASRLNLSSVFVELRIAPRQNPSQVGANLLNSVELQGNQPIWRILRAFRQEGLGLAVIGAPGSGKTTLLHSVLLTYAENRQWRQLMRAKIPLLLYLREHTARLICDTPPNLAELAQDAVQGQLAQTSTLQPPSKWFASLLESGRCMVLLDGLDEVADEASRKKVSLWVDAQIVKYHGCQFIVTARPHGYQTAPLQRVQAVEIQPFTACQVRQFVSQWYQANEFVSSGCQNSEDVRIRARKQAADLLNRLGSVPALNDLTVNPLLLTMLVMVHRYHGALPGSRVQLYAEICQVLLERWRGVKGVADKLRGDQKLLVLRPLAAHMMLQNCKEISTEAAFKTISPHLKRVGFATEHNKSFLTELQASSGLLLEREHERWSFAHLTFQEYLTAAHWLEEKLVEQNWDALVMASWWHETLRLYAAQADATPIIRACLARQEPATLALMWDCLEEAREIQPELRDEVEARLQSSLEQVDSHDWHSAAKIHLARTLSRGFVPLHDEAGISLAPFINSEFQLFLDGAFPESDAARPAHWKDRKFPSSSGREPVVGLTARSVQQFCDWLNQNHAGGVWHYRLPTESEVQAYATGAVEKFGVWCSASANSDSRLCGPKATVANSIPTLLKQAFCRKPENPSNPSPFYLRSPLGIPSKEFNSLWDITAKKYRSFVIVAAAFLAIVSYVLSERLSLSKLISDGETYYWIFGCGSFLLLIFSLGVYSLRKFITEASDFLRQKHMLGAELEQAKANVIFRLCLYEHACELARALELVLGTPLSLDPARDFDAMCMIDLPGSKNFAARVTRELNRDRNLARKLVESLTQSPEIRNEIVRVFENGASPSEQLRSKLSLLVADLDVQIDSESLESIEVRRKLILARSLALLLASNTIERRLAANRFQAAVLGLLHVGLEQKAKPSRLFSLLRWVGFYKAIQLWPYYAHWQRQLEWLQMQGQAPALGALVIVRERNQSIAS